MFESNTDFPPSPLPNELEFETFILINLKFFFLNSVTNILATLFQLEENFYFI